MVTGSQGQHSPQSAGQILPLDLSADDTGVSSLWKRIELYTDDCWEQEDIIIQKMFLKSIAWFYNWVFLTLILASEIKNLICGGNRQKG